MTRRIFWTTREEQEVLKSIQQLAQNRHNFSSWTAVLNESQKVLPEDRRRPVRHNMKNTKLINAARRALIQRPDDVSTVEKVHVVTPQPAKPAIVENLEADNDGMPELKTPTPSNESHVFKPSEEEDGLSQAIQELAKVLAKQVVHELKSSLRSTLALIVREETARQDKIKVCVIGPLPAQQQRLKALVGDQFDLTFVASDAGYAVAQKASTASHHVVVWTDFVSHAMYPKGKGCQLVSGGIETLANAVKSYA